MPRTSERGGPQTRARIAEVAAGLFLERGFENVTVSQVAQEAGVSSVTVFNHFPRKEDLYLDRSADAEDALRSAVRDRPAGVDVLTSLEAMTLRLLDDRAPVSGLGRHSASYFRTVAASPALIARAREIAADLQRTLADELTADPTYDGDSTLFAALFVAGYATVLTGTAQKLIHGEGPDEVAADHRVRLQQLFAVLRGGLGGREKLADALELTEHRR